METCANCKYWNRLGMSYGECKRYPPIRDDRYDNTSKPSGFTYPKVFDVNGCGEYAKIVPQEFSKK